MTPAHLLADSNNKRALCGSAEYPRVLAEHFDTHHDNYGLPACPDCTAAGDRTALLDEADQ